MFSTDGWFKLPGWCEDLKCSEDVKVTTHRQTIFERRKFPFKMVLESTKLGCNYTECLVACLNLSFDIFVHLTLDSLTSNLHLVVVVTNGFATTKSNQYIEAKHHRSIY